ncbi:hypothetical protein NE237_030554 [Protea cynaroides]|uniref:Uncharacterized protein n=1 Tax=Protea cynaroides TaxID=273540 RepID=A0A9Q0GT95_9MAGN|nr:hypothetical protein NE237_030554 [Protea cynaroides]
MEPKVVVIYFSVASSALSPAANRTGVSVFGIRLWSWADQLGQPHLLLDPPAQVLTKVSSSHPQSLTFEAAHQNHQEKLLDDNEHPPRGNTSERSSVVPRWYQSLAMDQRVEQIENKMESLSLGKKEVLNQITEMINKLTARVDQLAGQSSNEVTENSAFSSGQGPISVKPYQYPYFQKTEIEKIVAEMLSSGDQAQ